ncbi:Protein of unknown function DUF2620 [Pasteurella testudinis DSM 23072]|uniref:DUF2620 domain-containing protein n=1 Tax=Pasteurella testudinis DSM 23072 TaxID=1122938 RepID=A0A1W1UH53_9PAST|nr:DUF2620 domain-containing protein [Pasteurella testudinis]SMB80141.1 Protein of unknown function DUF2620 [Pasteurella testudinis DSM 23072]SUB50589.1 Protein of uncharacterised function DUF2620 [Pasteurella testudinis]
MRIVVGGQIEKALVAKTLQQQFEQHNIEADIHITSDIEAAMAIKSGNADYYFGACNTGGGGALAMAIALLGADKCATLGMPGKVLSDAEIIQQIQAGKIAFGFTGQDTEKIVPLVVKQLIDHSDNA